MSNRAGRTRRKLLLKTVTTSAVVTAVAAQGKWTTPLITSVLLPVHAQTSGAATTTTPVPLVFVVVSISVADCVFDATGVLTIRNDSGLTLDVTSLTVNSGYEIVSIMPDPLTSIVQGGVIIVNLTSSGTCSPADGVLTLTSDCCGRTTVNFTLNTGMP